MTLSFYFNLTHSLFSLYD